MIIVGSTAINLNIHKTYREPKDTDYLCTLKEWQKMCDLYQSSAKVIEFIGNKGHIQKDNGFHLEFEITSGKDSTADLIKYCSKTKSKADIADVAPLEVLLLLKMSHRYKKNSPHFFKTMQDIHALRKLGAKIPPELEPVLKKREKETYTYAHPKLNVSKDTFFTDEVGYIYDHDSIHEAIALLGKPAYTNYIVEGAEVLTSKEKFFAQEEVTKLLGVYEETCVLALERSQVPFNFTIEPEKSFVFALQKVCTSITSGWFREYAWENFYTVMRMYEKFGKTDYIQRFKNNQDMLRPFKED